MGQGKNRRKLVIYRKLYLTGEDKILRPGSIPFISYGRRYIWSAFGLQNIQKIGTFIEKIEVNELETYEYSQRIKDTEVSHTCPICDIPKPDQSQMNFYWTNVETTRRKKE